MDHGLWTIDLQQMIIDSLQSAEKYYGLHKNFKVAFDYLKSTDLLALEPGVIQVADGVKVIASNDPGKTAEVAQKHFECHRQNIDIQLCIHGHETMGWKPLSACTDPQADYSAEKDVQFFFDKPDMYFALTDGQFVIFYPDDVHAPMIGNDLIKKLVVKVRID